MELWLLIAVVLLLVWWAMRRPADCVIIWRAGRLQVSGTLPSGLQPLLEEFLVRELAESRRLRIDLRYPRGGRPLQFTVRGSVSAGERQMIRNFLLAEL